MLFNLKYLREKKGLSQSELAKAVGMTQQAINKYENQSTEPDIDTLKKLAAYFGTSIDFLVGNTDIERKYEAVTKSDLNTEELMMMEAYRDSEPKYRDILLDLIRKLNGKNS